ncbi:unnamed protein product [Polarella glacialis]|uniref:Uncharacterized protein n=1 Tax=Polarella glacialis TaxID=89957 RepID=A0A813FVK7_POLGL|nr:unnamed protein product [Polarella glacialis]
MASHDEGPPTAFGRWLPRRQREFEPAWHKRARQLRAQDRMVCRLVAACLRLSQHHGSAVPQVLRGLAPAIVTASRTTPTTPAGSNTAPATSPRTTTMTASTSMADSGTRADARNKAASRTTAVSRKTVAPTLCASGITAALKRSATAAAKSVKVVTSQLNPNAHAFVPRGVVQSAGASVQTFAGSFAQMAVAGSIDDSSSEGSAESEFWGSRTPAPCVKTASRTLAASQPTARPLTEHFDFDALMAELATTPPLPKVSAPAQRPGGIPAPWELHFSEEAFHITGTRTTVSLCGGRRQLGAPYSGMGEMGCGMVTAGWKGGTGGMGCMVGDSRMGGRGWTWWH